MTSSKILTAAFEDAALILRYFGRPLSKAATQGSAVASTSAPAQATSSGTAPLSRVAASFGQPMRATTTAGSGSQRAMSS